MKLNIGSIAPEFTAIDSNGIKINLSDLIQNGPIVLVFLRGFIWPFARKHLGQMKQDIKQFTDRMAQIVVIAPHETEKVKAYWKKENIPFIGIPDPDGKIGKLYGQEWNLIKLGRMPALFIIDQKDTIVFSHYANYMADIPENGKLFRILEELK